MEIKRVFDLLQHYVEKYPNQQVALAGKKNGEWVKYSIQDYIEHANLLSYAMIELGIQPNDKVAMILTNRPEWNMLDMAISQIGAVTVPVYPTISEEDYRFILADSDAKLVIIDGLSVMNKVYCFLVSIDTSFCTKWIYYSLRSGSSIPLYGTTMMPIIIGLLPIGGLSNYILPFCFR